MFEIGRALERHRAAGEAVGGFDLGLRETERGQKVEARRVVTLRRDLERLRERLGAKRPFVEDEADVEGGAKRGLDLVDRFVGEALGLERGVVDAGRMGERRPADRVSHDVGDLLLVIAERPQGLGRGAVDDLEIAAPGELLELDQREVGLDAGRVAIHHEADGAGRRNHRDLRVAIAMRLAERQRVAPGGARGFAQVRPRRTRFGELVMVERGRGDRERLVTRGLALRRALVVADHAQHRVCIGLVAGEGAAFCRDLGRGRVRPAGEDGGERGADRPAVVAVIRNARRHEQAADVGVAEAERAVVVGKARDLAGGELRHRDRDFEGQRPQANRVLVALDVERLGRRVAELQKVEGGEIAGRVVEEHVFGARIRRADRPRFGQVCQSLMVV